MNPLSAYGEGKRAGELLCALYHQQHGLETAIARCFTFVGPHLPLNAHFAIGNFIRDTLRGESIQIKDGRPYRSYLYIADLVIWLWTILFKGQPCSPYNVGSDQEISIADLAQSVGTVMTGRGINKEPSSQILTSTIFQPSRYVPSIALAKTTLDLQVWITLEEAIRRTTAWNLC
jgi:dTDP-glucose 4,6-dehydratase